MRNRPVSQNTITMKIKNISFIFTILLLGSITIFQTACKKEEDNDEPTPSMQFIDYRDGQRYSYVTIGTQTWMDENLNCKTSNSWLHDSLVNGDVYGRLYTWYAALNACPGGWHLPRDYEWKKLANFLGGNKFQWIFRPPWGLPLFK
jgi:Fibrobacter succinogenes major domain (Fib_succ_major)